MLFKKHSLNYTLAFVIALLAINFLSCTGNKTGYKTDKPESTGDTLIDELTEKILNDSMSAVNYFNRSDAYAKKGFYDLAFVTSN